MKTYKIAYLNHMLLAIAPDGDDASFDDQLRAARAEFHEEITPRIESGLTLTNDDEEGDDIRFTDYQGQLVDETGANWQYAVRRK